MKFSDLKLKYKNIIYQLICEGFSDVDLSNINSDLVKIDVPFDENKGDIAVPFFSFSKILKKSPADICKIICELFNKKLNNDKNIKKELFVDKLDCQSGYLNIYLDRNRVITYLFGEFKKDRNAILKGNSLNGQKVMVEFSCPNTNKTLHLGHLRNDALGFSISNILESCGAEVLRVNLVNDRGIHICKSMLAYKKFKDGKTPQSENVKSDKFIADCYVLYNKYEQESEQEAKSQIQEMLRKWENSDPETIELWKKLRKWALDGINETYKKTGIEFDKVYYESELYKQGKEEVLKGLEKGLFFKDESGAIMVEIDGKNKVLLRQDGTSIYLTQDIGTALKRYEDYKYDRCVYVVGNEQIDHFKTLFAIMKKLQTPFADKLYHLAYGMVNLPNGKMKSREGTVVDADDLIKELEEMAEKNITSDVSSKEREEISQKVALGALNYYLLSFTPSKDMLFDSQKSISFNGDTGPYIQYSAARIQSIIRKNDDKSDIQAFSKLELPIERMLVFYIYSYTDMLEKSASLYDPSLLVSYLYNICKTFSRYYHDVPILKADTETRKERIKLIELLLEVIHNAMQQSGIPFLTQM